MLFFFLLKTIYAIRTYVHIVEVSTRSLAEQQCIELLVFVRCEIRLVGRKRMGDDGGRR